MWETLDEDEAEAIRAHLVVLRGGAMFLSADDSALLRAWLTEGWTSTAIILALERAAQSRAKRPSRIPLSLRSAKRHLGKAVKGAVVTAPGNEVPAGLERLLEAVRSYRSHEESSLMLDELEQGLCALQGIEADALESMAIRACDAFLLRVWDAMAPEAREHALAEAKECLKGVASMMSAEAVSASAEEIARRQVRERYPSLSAASVRVLLTGAAARGSS